MLNLFFGPKAFFLFFIFLFFCFFCLVVVLLKLLIGLNGNLLLHATHVGALAYRLGGGRSLGARLGRRRRSILLLDDFLCVVDVTEAEPFTRKLLSSSVPARLSLGVAGEARMLLLLHRDLLGLGTRTDVVVGMLTLEVTPDALGNLLLGSTNTESVLATVVVEDHGSHGIRLELFERLGICRGLELLSLAGLLGGLRCGHLCRKPLLRHVRDIVGEAAVDEVDERIGDALVKLIGSDELVNADLHVGHC